MVGIGSLGEEDQRHAGFAAENRVKRAQCGAEDRVSMQT